jgi:5,10-methylenetetrahydrofolate reductase
MPSLLAQKLAQGAFVITAEVCPPKGCDVSGFLTKARLVAPAVDAINVTDNQGANMRLSPLAAAALLIREGIEPIYQLTCRDRNRLALQSDLLGAAALGITNILALTGDHISFGDHRQGKPVFDLDSVQLLTAIRTLASGHDLAGRPLTGSPEFFVGAAAAPEAEPFAATVPKLRQKADAGAQFFQTQAVFTPERLAQFRAMTASLRVKTIAGILVLKSAGMARYINEHIPGLTIPEAVVDELDASASPLQTGIDIALRQMRAARPYCDGLHLMVMGREELIPELVKEMTSCR